MLIILYSLHNKEFINPIWPFYILHKQIYTSLQQLNTHPHTKIQAHTTFTTRLTKLMTISSILTIWLSFIFPTHQAHTLYTPHIQPRQCTTKNSIQLVASNYIKNFQIGSSHKNYTHHCTYKQECSPTNWVIIGSPLAFFWGLNIAKRLQKK